MILYNVTVNIDEDAHEAWLKWMVETHIPDVMKTGFFLESKLARILAEEAGGLAYSVQYFAKNREDYDTYMRDHAPALRADHEKHFGQKIASFRTLLHIIHQTP